MKTRVTLLLVFTFAILSPALQAETANEREFKQMRAERDKAAAAALEPNTRRDKDGLDRIAKRVTAEPDLAKAIQAELQVIGGTAAAVAAALPAGATADKTTLRKLFEETEWGSADGNHTFFFRRGGTFTSNGSWGKHYDVDAPDVLTLCTQNPKQNRKAPFRCCV